MAKDERRYTISESNTTWIMESVDRIRGEKTRSEACLKLLAFMMQSPDSCKAIINGDLTQLPPLEQVPQAVVPIETTSS